jgi:glycosyltransferase involved in cell wall biosynthesis
MLAEYLKSDYEIKLIGGLGIKGEVTNLDIFKNIDSEPIIIDEFSRSFNIFKDYKAYKKIYNFIKSFKPDIVHTHTTKPGLIARMAAKKAGVKNIVHTYHGNLFTAYFPFFVNFILVFMERFLAKCTSKIICLSESQKNDMLTKYKIGNESQYEIIPLGVDESRFEDTNDEKRKRFRSEYKLNDDEIAIGIVGRLSKIKNIKFFIEALSIVKIKSSKSIRAFIIGDGPEKQVLKQVSIYEGINYVEYSYNNRKADLIFTSWCKNIDDAMFGLDIIALTSKNEGTPMSLIEAQMSGKASVSFDVGGVKDIIKNNKTALMADRKDYADFINKLLELIENESLREELGKSAYKFARENFSLNIFIDNYKKFYSNLISKNKS